MRAGNDMVVFDSMLRSNMQPEEKSQIRRWAESMLGPITQVRAKDATGGALSAFRQGSEGLATAAALAWVHVNSKTGLDVAGVPIDGASGGGLLLASVFMGHSELSADARNIGNDALTVWGFRKMTDFFADRRLASGRTLPNHLTRPGSHVSGDVNNDPIVSAASDL